MMHRDLEHGMEAPPTSKGIHHITVLASDPQRNADFYTDVLGLRLVKRTVNFDAPGVYHLYYGDEVGTPGTILTFFPYPNAAQGKRGSGEIHAIGYKIPAASLDFWVHRLSAKGLHFDGPAERFGDTVISFLDPDGLKIELVALADAGDIRPWNDGAVDPMHALRRFAGVTLAYLNDTWTQRFLAGTMGFRKNDATGKRTRFVLGEGAERACVDTLVLDGITPPRPSAGSVHHIAWRSAGDAEQLKWREHLMNEGTYPTEVIDRQYFHSIYFREPGGVLFEIATDGPGFSIDEPLDSLGQSLRLPSVYEPERERIERSLIPLRVRHAAGSRQHA